jgi:drug/metabolite transporter (DMT)-like permease
MSDRVVSAGGAVESSHWRGILFMLLGTALFTFNDALGKWMVASVAVGQLLFIRSATALVVLLPAVHKAGWRKVFVLQQPGQHALRLAFIVAEVSLLLSRRAASTTGRCDGGVSGHTADRHHPGDFRCWVRRSAGAAAWRSESVSSACCWSCSPDGGVFTAPALIALGGSFTYALSMVATRKLRETNSLSLIVYHSIAVGGFGLLTLPWGWEPIDLPGIGYLALIGVVATAAHMCMNQSLKLAPAAVVVPFTYTSLLWAILLGWLFFADLPTPLMLLGAGIIVASGLFVLHRERQIKAG